MCSFYMKKVAIKPKLTLDTIWYSYCLVVASLTIKAQNVGLRITLKLQVSLNIKFKFNVQCMNCNLHRTLNDFFLNFYAV